MPKQSPFCQQQPLPKIPLLSDNTQITIIAIITQTQILSKMPLLLQQHELQQGLHESPIKIHLRIIYQQLHSLQQPEPQLSLPLFMKRSITRIMNHKIVLLSPSQQPLFLPNKPNIILPPFLINHTYYSFHRSIRIKVRIQG